MAQKLLIADSEPATVAQIDRALAHVGFELTYATTNEQAKHALQNSFYHAMLIDIACAGLDGFGLLEWALKSERCKAVIVITSNASIPMAVRAIRAGALDYITKPLDAPALLHALQDVLGENSGPDLEGMHVWRAQYAPQFIGEDPKTLQALSVIRRIANTDCDVLITGPSGTGKELVARCIHTASRRAHKPFIALNCAAIPRDLIESEIFGHARGSFTGATERRAGKFEIANQGSLFLDEMGEMDLGLQGKFLRVIQEREVTPVGDSRTVRLDVRIISATNQDLLGMCRDKTFREDLYYRLNVVPIELLPLAERPLDIPVLVDHFIERANRRHGRRIQQPQRSAMDALMRYGWPGNVRELQNIVERIVVLKATDGPIFREDLPTCVIPRAALSDHHDVTLPEDGLDLNETLANVEMRLTLNALQRAKGNKARAAELLGLKRTTLVERLKKLHIDDA